MRPLPLFLAAITLSTAPAYAQVTVDLRALDALPHLPGPAAHRPLMAPRHPAVAPSQPPLAAAPTAGTKGVPPAGVTAGAPVTAGAAPPAASAAATAASSAGLPGAPATPTRTATATAAPPMPPTAAAPPTVVPPSAPPPATFAAAPPPTAVIPPVAPPATLPNPTAPTPPPIAASAATKAAPTPAGVRLTFAKAQSDLSPGSAASIKSLVQAAPHTDTTTYNVLAYAAGDSGDPSAARRLSLARALAVRTALLADGVSSARIYLRALGEEPGGGGPPDRVDINVLGGNDNSAAQR